MRNRPTSGPSDLADRSNSVGDDTDDIDWRNSRSSDTDQPAASSSPPSTHPHDFHPRPHAIVLSPWRLSSPTPPSRRLSSKGTAHILMLLGLPSCFTSLGGPDPQVEVFSGWFPISKNDKIEEGFLRSQ
ncbi:unnamed protein product [Schistocephalus solidus]|uniref:Uncharacterized protein n=1 Tax=Schistocephalus solidus TaxID=70667 RepID=A0A183SJ29_SCHSO|nr:unnamed protein product [Schistocephalus solidus]